jgi:hypothetical protein
MDSASRPSARMMSSAASTICSSVSVGGLPRFAVPDAEPVPASFAVIGALRPVARVDPLMLDDGLVGGAALDSESLEQSVVGHRWPAKEQTR